MTEERQRLASAIHRVGAVWRARLDERLRPWKMTQATWRTLWVLRLAEERYNQRSLATRLGIETPTMVHIVDRMESLGLLVREPDSRDRRQKFIAITEAGLKLAEEIEGEVLAVREEMLRGIPDTELALALGIFERILANAGQPGEAEG